jgi:type I protein arginine methyltransferase
LQPNWDLQSLDVGLDFYGLIKLVNYVRSEVKTGNKNPDIASVAFLEGDTYLRPVLEGDALLFSLDDLPDGHGSEDKTSQGDGSLARIAQLEEELQRLRLEYANYKLGVMFSSLEGPMGESTASAPAVPSNGKTAAAEEPERDDDSHYFTSYSHNGVFAASNPWSLRSSTLNIPRRYP